MVFNHRSNDKRSDKETQSPMLRVFKEIMLKEHKDSEKSNLLKEKQEKPKKKSQRRTKSDQKAGDSSGLERPKHKKKKKMADENINEKHNWTFNQDRTKSVPFQSEKRDSWWLWKDTDKKRTDDTCSCATCPLKKLVGSDYACISCLVFVFLVSVAVTFGLIFKTMPLSLGVSKEVSPDTKMKPSSEAPGTERKTWDPDMATRLDTYPGLFGPGYGESSFQESNLLDEGVSSELAGLIGSDKMNEIQRSEKLREFYKKLLETDAQIRRLKGLEANRIANTDINHDVNTLDRYKRSAKVVAKHRTSGNNSRKKNTKRQKKANSTNNVNRSKRGKLGSPEGFIIENKRVFVQYKPIQRIPKCSHAPKESHSYEKHRKHPFYQNSQRLDELLGHILDRNVPKMMTNPMALDVLFSNKVKCGHTTNADKGEEGTTKAISTNKDVNQNELVWNGINKNIKEAIKTESVPLINQYTLNVTNDNVMENTQNSQNLRKSLKVENKDKGFHDHSSKFMAKIHEDNQVRTTLKGYFDEMDKQYKSVNNISPEINYDNYRKFYNQNVDFTHQNDISRDNDKRLDENDRVDDQYNRDISNNNLLEMMIDRTSTERKYDMNLDYNDILFPVTSKMPALQGNENNVPNDKYTNEQRSNSYNLRKLQQIDEGNDDTIAYEDLKEVLADDMEAHDEIERQLERKKRNNNIPDLYNRNWKGSIPLYPDELNAIIQQAALESIKVPIKTRDIVENDKTKQISDTHYIEEYFDNKYDGLVEMAQAYSDYGVLDNKKEPVDQKDVTVTQNLNRHKLSVEETGYPNMELQGAPSKSEGIRFELRPGKCSKSGIFKSIRKHFKLKNVPKTSPTTQIPFIPSYNPILNPTSINNQLVKSNVITKNLYTKKGGPVALPKRGLKSVAYIDEDDFENRDAGIVTDINTISSEPVIVNETEKNKVDGNDSSKNCNSSKSGMGASEFFAMVSDWFNTLAKLSDDTTGLTNTSMKRNNTEEVIYPSYDSDMIENIGHRSRVLLSLEEKNDSVKITDVRDGEERSTKDNLQVTGTVKTDSGTVTIKDGIKTTTVANIIVKHGNNVNKDTIENKTISKRSAERNNKFWNDIYDDEYGVKIDYFEKPRIDRHSSKNNFVKRSKNWIGGKVKDIANKFRSTKGGISAVTERRPTEDFYSLLLTPKRTSSKRRRKIRNINIIGVDADDTSDDFVALTANMKKVIREAVNAVKNTRNIKAREDSPEDAAASSLMQQLVGLMADVVDFQVQKRTCSKLPPDLQKFLEWLTSPSEKGNMMSELDAFSAKNEYRYGKTADDTSLLLPEDHLEDRTQCLGSIQAVQELMRQYDEMDEQEKSKMTGVKKYLENQLDFLNGKVNSLDEINVYKNYKKRETNRFNRAMKRRNAQKKRVRRIKRLIKNYNKNRTTSSIIVTETKKMKKK